MENWIVTTTINPPTPAIEKLALSSSWGKVAVGDKKTPEDWKHDQFSYLSPEAQEKTNYETAKLLPWNLPARAMIGFLYAMEHGATTISQVDDDNIPYGVWDIPSYTGEYAHIKEEGFVNIYKNFTDVFIWPRGYPLDKIKDQKTATEEKQQSTVGVWQHLADQDTDVDAIYRLTRGDTITFTQREPVVLAPGAVCPFNCQSTTFEKTLFPLLYLPAFVSPRESDIIRGLIAQPLMWHAGKTLGFTAPNVTQERNPHDYRKDFAAELRIYLHAEEIYNIARTHSSPEASLEQNLKNVYAALVEAHIVPPAELPLLDAWLADVKRLQK
ncbi:MAG: STELLO glycosyltransferase family protein [Patescibacteria group bacterium]